MPTPVWARAGLVPTEACACTAFAGDWDAAPTSSTAATISGMGAGRLQSLARALVWGGAQSGRESRHRFTQLVDKPRPSTGRGRFREQPFTVQVAECSRPHHSCSISRQVRFANWGSHTSRCLRCLKGAASKLLTAVLMSVPASNALPMCSRQALKRRPVSRCACAKLVTWP